MISPDIGAFESLRIRLEASSWFNWWYPNAWDLERVSKLVFFYLVTCKVNRRSTYTNSAFRMTWEILKFENWAFLISERWKNWADNNLGIFEESKKKVTLPPNIYTYWALPSLNKDRSLSFARPYAHDWSFSHLLCASLSNRDNSIDKASTLEKIYCLIVACCLNVQLQLVQLRLFYFE